MKKTKNETFQKEFNKIFLKRLIYLGPMLSIISVLIFFSAESQIEKIVSVIMFLLGIAIYSYGKKSQK